MGMRVPQYIAPPPPLPPGYKNNITIIIEQILIYYLTGIRDDQNQQLLDQASFRYVFHKLNLCLDKDYFCIFYSFIMQYILL